MPSWFSFWVVGDRSILCLELDPRTTSDLRRASDVGRWFAALFRPLASGNSCLCHCYLCTTHRPIDTGTGRQQREREREGSNSELTSQHSCMFMFVGDCDYHKQGHHRMGLLLPGRHLFGPREGRSYFHFGPKATHNISVNVSALKWNYAFSCIFHFHLKP